jgi:hypothetical protein
MNFLFRQQHMQILVVEHLHSLFLDGSLVPVEEMGWVLHQPVDWFISQRNSRQRQKKQKHGV